MFIAKLARTANQLFCRGVLAVLHSRRWKFLKHVHNLFTHVLWSSSPAGLRLEISRKSDKKKMNLIFNCVRKIFLTGKMKRACRNKNRNSVLRKPGANQIARIRHPRAKPISLLTVRHCRVDRIGVCAKFPAFASVEQTLSKL